MIKNANLYFVSTFGRKPYIESLNKMLFYHRDYHAMRLQISACITVFSGIVCFSLL